MKRALPVLSAAVSTLVAFSAALLVERALARLVGFDLAEVQWISDVVLAVAFGAATFLWLHLRRARRALTRLERARLVLDTELSIAADIQQGLLPPPPRARDGWRFAARLEHAGHVGGDFFDFVEGDGFVLLLLADISGKGIPAALVMASARALFRQIARETDSVADVVVRLSRALFDEQRGQPYLTGFLARLDLAGGGVQWVNAGHPAALVVRGTGHRTLAATGPPAGLLPDAAYAADELRLTPGDTLVVVSDGVTEALEAGGRVEERIAWTVAQKRAKGPIAVCDRVMRLAAAGRGPVGAGEWTDDRTVVAVTLDRA